MTKDFKQPNILALKIPTHYLKLQASASLKELKHHEKQKRYFEAVQVRHYTPGANKCILVDKAGQVYTGRVRPHYAAIAYAYKHRHSLNLHATVTRLFTSPNLLMFNLKLLPYVGRYTHFYPMYKADQVENDQMIQDLNRLSAETPLAQLVPPSLLQKYYLLPIVQAVKLIHWPLATTYTELQHQKERAVYSLAVEELVATLIQNDLNAKSILKKGQRPVPLVQVVREQWQNLQRQLPFTLTASQQHALSDLYNDFNRERPMYRLLQGDVGCGKTIVFTAAILQVALSNLLTCVLAPSTLLAQQHYASLKRYLVSFDIPVFLVLGSRTLKATKNLIAEAASKRNAVIISTDFIWHATIQANTGLLIIDEQHKYGLQKRNKFLQQTRYEVHLLLVTATPIPRALMMSIYGSMDLTNIRGKPEARKTVATYILKAAEIPALCKKIQEHISRGNQVYWICPRLGTTKALSSKTSGPQRAGLYDSFHRVKKLLPTLNVECVHGKLGIEEKELTLKRFMSGQTDILMGTSVMEVGLDVPNATVMVIEDATFFGLASLHQMRGRVGRREKQSYCFLLYASTSSSLRSLQRLQTLKSCQDGYDIAQQDLASRGPGHMLGIKQAGIPKFRFFTWEKAREIIPIAQALSEELTREHPELILPLIDRWKSLRFLEDS